VLHITKTTPIINQVIRKLSGKTGFYTTISDKK